MPNRRRGPPPDPLKYIDMSYLQQAIKELGKNSEMSFPHLPIISHLTEGDKDVERRTI